MDSFGDSEIGRDRQAMQNKILGNSGGGQNLDFEMWGGLVPPRIMAPTRMHTSLHPTCFFFSFQSEVSWPRSTDDYLRVHLLWIFNIFILRALHYQLIWSKIVQTRKENFILMQLKQPHFSLF